VTDWNNDPFIDGIANELRQPVRLDPRFDDRVMAALNAPAVIPLHRTVKRTWLQRRLTISVTPLGGLAAAAAIGTIIVLGARMGTSVSFPNVAATTSALPIVPVVNSPVDVENMIVQRQLTILIPTATKVAVVGDFNDWDASRGLMQRLTPDGLWSVTIPLRVGRHEYQFLVDDTLRVPDPTMPQTTSDFGASNSVITVGPRNP
jgi:hypothetical protein